MLNPQNDLMLLLATLLLALFVLHGCAEPSVVYKDKLIPIKCKIDKTPEPVETEKLGVDVRNIFMYVEILEEDIAFCRKEVESTTNFYKGESK